MKIILHFTILAAAGLSLDGCDQDAPSWTAQKDIAVCARNGVRVPDGNCSSGYRGGGAGGWYYYNRGAALPYYGDRVSGGSFTRTAGATYFHAPVETGMSRSTAIARGGFGASAQAFGGLGE